MPLTQVKPGYKASYSSAQAANYKQMTIPSPALGLDLSTPLTDQDPKAAVVLDNFLCRRVGVEMRKGSKRWNSNIGGVGTAAEVISLMDYNPAGGVDSVTLPRLFAACSDLKIYDVTDSTDEASTPPLAETIPGQLAPGVFSWTNFATGGTNFLCICAVGGGYWTYDHGSGWNQRIITYTPTAGTPTDISLEVDFVMVWKNRLWFIKNNSTEAYYLETAAIQGDAHKFDFGPMLVHGGDLCAMATWTLDSGDGIDDRLVLVGRGGDVLVYQGTDPTSATLFGIVGRWYTAKPPDGRRFMSKYGGDLYMLTELGVEYITNLLKGQGLLEQAQGADPARRFNETIGIDVRATRGQRFWSMINVVGEDGIVVQTPYNQAGKSRQYFFGLLSRGWSRLTGWPGICFEEHQGSLFYGTRSGTVCKAFTGDTDDQLSDGTPGISPRWELQSSFVAPNGDRTSLKRPQLLRLMFQGRIAPEIKAKINTEWSVAAISGSPPVAPIDTSEWDVAVWNVGKWTADAVAFNTWLGVEGLGIYFSLRMSVRGVPGTFFNSWSVTYESGGMM